MDIPGLWLDGPDDDVVEAPNVCTDQSRTMREGEGGGEGWSWEGDNRW